MSSRLDWIPTRTELVPARLRRGRGRTVAVLVAVVLTLAAFLFSIRLLGAATEAAAPLLREIFLQVVRSDTAAIGAGWVATYSLANGSVVAALSLTLFTAEIVTLDQLYMLVAGSRLGAAAIVLLLGGLEYLRRSPYSLRKATSLGVLTFLLTLSIYIPSTLLGYLSLPWLQPRVAEFTGSLGFTVQPLTIFTGGTDWVVTVVGPAPGFVLGLGLLYGCLETFDRLLGTVDPSALRRHFFRRLSRRWVSFVVGLVVTSLSTSVAFSLGVIVAPYNRGYIKRREIVPYVLGANIGTLLDTVIIAFLLGTEPGAVAVIILVAWSILVTALALTLYEPYFGAVEWTQKKLLEDRRLYLGFLAFLALVPLIVLIVGL